MSPWFCKSAIQILSVSPTISSVDRTLGMVLVASTCQAMPVQLSRRRGGKHTTDLPYCLTGMCLGWFGLCRVALCA